MQKPFETRRERMAIFLLIIYAVVVYIFDGSETNVKLIYLAYGFLCLYLVYILRTIRIYMETSWILAYLVFSTFSILWSENAATSFTRVKGVALLTVLLVLTTTYAIRIQNPTGLLYALMIGALSLSGYMFLLYGVSGIINALGQTENRIGWLINNVNAVANSLVVGAVALFGTAIFYRKWIFLVLLIPVGICILAAGSRTAVISLLVGVLAIAFFAIRSKENLSQAILWAIGIFAGLLIVWVALRNLTATQQLIIRIENAIAVFTGRQAVYKESSSQGRLDYIKLGWAYFLKSPIWGNGIGCAGYAIVEEFGRITYLHNNYIELLASGGIIGFFLYYAPYFSVFIKLCKRAFRQHDKDPMVYIAFALLIAKLTSHMGTVMYYSKIEFLLLAFWIAVTYRPRGHGSIADNLGEVNK